jgi:hypothetical protein
VRGQLMSILQAAIDSLWYWTYGILVGWGASFTIVVALLVVLFVKVIRLNRKLSNLQNRVIVYEREISLYVNRKDKN